MRHATFAPTAVLAGLAVGLGLAGSALGLAPSTAHLRISVIEAESGRVTPVRVRLTAADGSPGPVPDEAIAVMYGPNDNAEGFAAQPDGAFYVEGAFEVASSWTPR
jgi:hypothetical protein